jgi:hypothetical protein
MSVEARWHLVFRLQELLQIQNLIELRSLAFKGAGCISQIHSRQM